MMLPEPQHDDSQPSRSTADDAGHPPNPSPAAQLDAWETGSWKQVAPEQIALQRNINVLWVAVLTILVAISLVVFWTTADLAATWKATISVLSLTVVAILWPLAFLWPQWSYQHTLYRLDERGFQIRRGVLWRHAIAIPAHRVQHIDVTQGPWQRAYGLGTLVIFTAGTQHASQELSGLVHQQAMQLRDQLVEMRGGVDVL